MRRDSHYFQWGLTAVCVVCAILLIYDVVFRGSIVIAYLGKLIYILAPVLYGAFMAYLLAPLVNWFEAVLFRRRPGKKTRLRGVSVALTWLVVIASLYLLLSILLPELYKGVRQLGGNVDSYYQTISAGVKRLLENNPALAQQAVDLFNRYYQEGLAWLRDNVVPQIQVAMQALTGGVVGAMVSTGGVSVGGTVG